MVQVIGAGMGRTSTLSLKNALEMLGLAPCHHMLEMRNVPQTADGWRKAALGKEVDFASLLQGYKASSDWPSEPSRQSACLSSTARMAGSRCADSSTYRCRTGPSRTRTPPRNSRPAFRKGCARKQTSQCTW